MGIKKMVKQVLIEKENRRYERLLAERSVSYEHWLADREKGIKERISLRQPSAQIREGQFECEGDYIIFSMKEGKLSKYAKELISYFFEKHPEVQIVYGDEDVLGKENPWFKPDWSPDLFDGWYYFGSVVAVRKKFLAENDNLCKEWQTIDEVILGRDETRFFVPWLKEFLEICGGWKRSCQAIGHIPEILFHCDSEAVLKRYMWWDTKRKRKWGEISHTEKNADTLSIVIPSKDHPDILGRCLNAIPKAAGTLPYEIIVVDNGSNEENKKRTEELLQTFEEKSCSQCTVKYIYQPMEFNFSKMCNMGAEASKGKLLLFLNDDVELFQENCLERLAELAGREYVGAAGIKLFYPNSVKIQHAGITNLPMGPVHKLQFHEDYNIYYFDANHRRRNVLAVTAACLMVEKEKYLEVQGFSEELKVAFNDVDFCFKLYKSGYFNVCHNDICAYHHESLSRGDDESLEKWKRLLAERDKLYAAHPDLEGVDPYYGAGLGREGLDTRIRPEYETAGNKLQTKNAEEEFSAEKLSAYRQDNCLLLRVENCRQGILQGYGVVLGDNNSFYDKEILLEKVEGNYA